MYLTLQSIGTEQRVGRVEARGTRQCQLYMAMINNTLGRQDGAAAAAQRGTRVRRACPAGHSPD